MQTVTCNLGLGGSLRKGKMMLCKIVKVTSTSTSMMVRDRVVPATTYRLTLDCGHEVCVSYRNETKYIKPEVGKQRKCPICP